MFSLTVPFLSLCVLSNALLPPWPLESTVETAKQYAAGAPLTRPTGLTRADYLPTIAGIVDFFVTYQNRSGNVIDPYRLEETQYATPCFAFACATIFKSQGRADLLPNCTAALTAALHELATANCADGHCVFFMKPSMFAYRILNSLVDPSVKAAWDASLEMMDPYKAFHGFPVSGNWGLVGTLDMLRTTYITHFGNASWWTRELDYQLEGQNIPETFTANGLYQDHSGMARLNPLPYDTFPTSGYLTVMLKEGYNGTWAPVLRELTTRAAWTHLLMQSPYGEIPTGGRSSQHTWNEAVSALAYEVNAGLFAAQGDMASACMFKRAAHLSLESVRRWQVVDGGGKRSRVQIVKNWADPSLRWGYEGYSFLSQYNLLPAAMLAAAYTYSEDSEASVSECPTFADVGGFVFELPEHHLVIANAGGVYVQVETGSDPHYDSTGLNRVHINTCGSSTDVAHCASPPPLLTFTAGPHQEDGGFSMGGPEWSMGGSSNSSGGGGGGGNFSLGNAAYSDVTAAVFTPVWVASSSSLAFTVSFDLDFGGNGTSLATVVQQYTLNSTAGGDAVTVASSLLLPRSYPIPASFALQLPLFLYNGRDNTTVAAAGERGFSVTSQDGSGGGVLLTVLPVPQKNISMVWKGEEVESRNGVLGRAWARVVPGTLSPSLTLTINAL